MSAIAEPWPTEPRGHKDPALVARKLGLLDAPHVKPLNDWVRQLNKAREGNNLLAGIPAGESTVPWFDPSGGGINASMLFLLEAPGRRAVASRGSGFISMDNNDGTAANMFKLTQGAGLQRHDFALWNIVPWYLPEGPRTKATELSDVVEAGPQLDSLLGLFGDLELVVVMGGHAAMGWEALRMTSAKAQSVTYESVPHPSATNLNTRPQHREAILEALKEAAQKL